MTKFDLVGVEPHYTFWAVGKEYIYKGAVINKFNKIIKKAA